MDSDEILQTPLICFSSIPFLPKLFYMKDNCHISMRYTGESQKVGRSILALIRVVFLIITPIVVFSVSAMPSIFLVASYFRYLYPLFSWFWFLFFLPFILVISFLILILSTALFTGATIRLFRLTYSEGEYRKSITDRNTYHFALYWILYRPTEKLLSTIFIPPIYSSYLRLIGAKIGKHVFFGGRNTISDPCVTEIGSYTLIGGGATIMSHLGEEKLVIRKATIGSHCLVGAEALIMPGVIMEDHSVLGGKSLVTKNKVLKKGNMYGGVPAVKIDRN
jgi:acetyltransferase-like isoleucine patch superfamily enzyme